MWNVFFNQLQERKLTHTKVQNKVYDGKRKPQPYLLNKKFDNKMTSLLFNQRCKTVNSFTDNFHTWYAKEPPCRLCKKYLSSQEHALVCDVIVKELTENQNQILNRTKYSDIFWKCWGARKYH